MGSIRVLLAVFCCLFPAMLSAAGAAAESRGAMPAPVVVLVDMQRILDESVAAKSVHKQLEVQRSKFQSQTEGEDNELRQAELDLSKSREQVAADAYAEKEQQLRQRFLAVERNVQARRKLLEQGFTNSMNQVKSNLLEIIQQLAQEKGANLVLTKQEVFWADKGFDVTDEVLSRLNKKLPQVTVTLPPQSAN